MIPAWRGGLLTPMTPPGSAPGYDVRRYWEAYGMNIELLQYEGCLIDGKEGEIRRLVHLLKWKELVGWNLPLLLRRCYSYGHVRISQSYSYGYVRISQSYSYGHVRISQSYLYGNVRTNITELFVRSLTDITAICTVRSYAHAGR